jgi:hypothetical protein
MIKTAVVVFGTLAMLAGPALAEPAPNTATAVYEGGAVYYNPEAAPRQPTRAQQPRQQSDAGKTDRNGEGYHAPSGRQGG